jgi:hypothetical protein
MVPALRGSVVQVSGLGELKSQQDAPMPKSSKISRIIYIESKAQSLNGPARIGRVTFSKTRATL